MTDEQIIKAGDLLMTIATMATLTGIALVLVREKGYQNIPQRLEVMMEKVEWKVPPEEEARKAHPVLVEEMELRNIWQSVDVDYITVETEYIGIYFLTAYSDEETYSRATASGIEVHYSDDPYEPTTCAIDRRYHRFGDLFMIDGKVYVAEDTGSAVTGAHIDCFVETMEEVRTFNTRYESVYSVEYVENHLTARERKVIHERFNDYLFDRSFGYWVPFRDRC
jgi:3D (Asp-Asp-Asp) domain-containing protein